MYDITWGYKWCPTHIVFFVFLRLVYHFSFCHVHRENRLSMQSDHLAVEKTSMDIFCMIAIKETCDLWKESIYQYW
jgi:hypothetical protein